MENASLAGYAAVYGGIICVFLVLLLILALCTIVVCKKNRKLKKNEKFYYGETLNHMRNGLLEQQQKALLSDEKKIPPHSSQFFTMSNICSPSPMHPSMTMRSAKSGYSGYSANRNAGSRAALITECSSSNSSSGGGKRALVRTSSNCSDDENYATLYDYMDEKSAVGLENPQSILAAQVDSAGARLQLRLGGASLLIPENALLSERMIYLALSDLVSDRPQLQPGESALSPVVMVGECSSDSDRSDDARRVLRKPMVVSFRHCASVFPRDNWTFSLYADEGFGWRKVVTLGEENLNTTVHVHMDPIGKGKGSQMGWCHVMTDNFSRMMLVGRSRRPSVTACKRAHLAAYGPAHRPEGDFELRIYCVPETGAAMENVSRQEENARLLAESDHFILNENGDLCFCIEDITEGFQIQGSPVVEIPSSSHQWCAQNGLHCSLHFTSDGRLPIEHFVSRLVVYQKTNPAERHLLQLRFEASIYDKPQPTVDKTVTVDFHLPAEVKEELAELLDPPSSPERDWRGLAKKLHFDRYVQFFATRPGCSPTSLLLDLWEAVECGSARAAPDLLQSLRVMGRPDAVLILEEYLANFSYLMEP